MHPMCAQLESSSLQIQAALSRVLFGCRELAREPVEAMPSQGFLSGAWQPRADNSSSTDPLPSLCLTRWNRISINCKCSWIPANLGFALPDAMVENFDARSE